MFSVYSLDMIVKPICNALIYNDLLFCDTVLLRKYWFFGPLVRWLKSLLSLVFTGVARR